MFASATCESMQAPTTDQIRNAIDSGATGEKVSMPDPAAAPLGTDDEAAGNPSTVQERAMAARQMPEAPQRAHHRVSGVTLYVGLVLAVALLIIVVMFRALQ
jgi:hypothetical protein